MTGVIIWLLITGSVLAAVVFAGVWLSQPGAKGTCRDSDHPDSGCESGP